MSRVAAYQANEITRQQEPSHGDIRPFVKAGEAVYSTTQEEHNIAFCAEKLMQGWNLAKMADALGVTHIIVANYLKVAQKRWLESSIVDFEKARSLEMAKIDSLEATFWDAWERSKKPKKISNQRSSPSARGQEMKITASVTTEERDGDPRFLDGVFKCIERRIKILGLDAAEKMSIGGIVDVRTSNDLERRLDRYKETFEAGIIDAETTHSARHDSGKPVDSKRSTPKTGIISDVVGRLREHSQ